jgi:hypothetical protein
MGSLQNAANPKSSEGDPATDTNGPGHGPLRKQADVKRVIARLLEPLVRLLVDGVGCRHRRSRNRDLHPYPYSCDYVAGPTGHRTGERPPRGEDSPLVRPYLIAHERQLAAEEVWLAAEERRQRGRRRTLWLAVRGVDIGPGFLHGAEAAA